MFSGFSILEYGVVAAAWLSLSVVVFLELRKDWKTHDFWGRLITVLYTLVPILFLFFRIGFKRDKYTD